jgi:vitamin B12 transporter
MASGQDPKEPLELPDIEVLTASRSPQDATEVLASISVISAEDIHRSAAEDLLELLRLQAGVDIVRSGPAGAQTSVFLRGSNSDHVLVLIDGVRAASAHTGTYAWELLPLSLIERIEIVRGPRATLYGSDAIGGVIHVFTRQLQAPAARLTLGSFGTGEVEVGIGARSSSGHYSLQAVWRRTDGFSAQNPAGFSYHPDDDGLETASVGLNGERQFRGGRWAFRVLASETESEFDQGVSEASQLLAAMTWHGRFRDGWDYQLQASVLDDELDSDYVFFTTGFESRRWDLGWLNRVDLDRGALTFGLDLSDETGLAADSYSSDRDNSALYSAWDLEAGRADLQMGLRLDDNSEFGSEWTYQLAAGLDLGASTRIIGQFGTAFRAPDLGEQFSPGFGGFFAGNPDLQPESSDSMELSLRQGLGSAATLSVGAYRTRVDDLIAFSGENFRAVNVKQAELAGLELELSLKREAWALRATATWQDTEDKSTGKSLLRRPDRKGSLSLDHTFNNGSWAGLDWFVSGPRLDVGSAPLPGYGLLSVRGGLAMTAALGIQLRLENLLDKAYEPAAGFNGAGRSVFVSLDWRP